MNQILRTLTVTTLCIGFMGGVSSAQSLENLNTGPGSTNNNIVDVQCDTVIDNNNEVIIENGNNQDSSSGNAGSTDNTTGGGATSGNAGNVNQTVTVIDIANGTPNNQDCPNVAGPANPPANGGDNGGGSGGGAPTATTVELSGGSGGGAVLGENFGGIGGGTGITTLPQTGANDVVTYVGAGAMAIGGITILSQVGSVMVRRFSV